MKILEVFTAPFKRRIAKMRYETAEYEIAEKQLSEAVRLIDKSNIDTDEKQWALIGAGKKELTQADYETLRKQSWIFWQKSPHARAVIRNLVKFIIGKGVIIQARDESVLVQKVWDDFQKNNLPHSKQKEIVRRILRDGEVFLRYFENKGDGTAKFRFIDPDFINDPTGANTFGIETDKDDIEKVLNYYRAGADGTLKEKISAEKICHYKILADNNEKRGRSFLQVLLPWITKYEKWLNDRIILNKVRTAVVLIKKITGSPAQAASLASSAATTKESTSDFKQQTLRPGTVITATPGVDYQFQSPKIEARDVKDDGRAILLSVVAGSGLAEYMVTGDASNQNYASTMIAESPAVREFEDWQSELVEIFQEMYRRVIQNAVDCGVIPAFSRHTEYYRDKVTGKEVKTRVRIPVSIECDVAFPPMIHRELKDETAAYVIHDMQGWASPDTISSKLGYNPIEERDKIRRAQAREEEDRAFEKQRATAMRIKKEEVEAEETEETEEQEEE